jgi:sulfite exporter TauE/SafE
VELTLGAILVTSLLGSVHCAAMCGPLAAVAGGTDAGAAGRAAYHAGRLCLYLVLGAAAGALGGGFNAVALGAGLPSDAAQVAGWLLVALGVLALARAAGWWFPRPLGAVGAFPRRVLTRLAQVRPAWRGLALGAASAFLPCGWLYAFAVTAAGTGSAESGALAMAAFWTGTVPAVAGAALVLQRLTGRLRRRLPAFTALVLIAIGLLTALGRARAAHHPPDSPVMTHAARHR